MPPPRRIGGLRGIPTLTRCTIFASRYVAYAACCAPIGDNSRPCPKNSASACGRSPGRPMPGAMPRFNSNGCAVKRIFRPWNGQDMNGSGGVWSAHATGPIPTSAVTCRCISVPSRETCARHYARSLPPRLDRTQRRRPVCSWTTARGSAGNWRASVRSPTRTKSTARVLRASACVTFSSRWPRNSAAQSGPSSP